MDEPSGSTNSRSEFGRRGKPRRPAGVTNRNKRFVINPESQSGEEGGAERWPKSD
ncbi:MAG: hypothetical protein AB7P42_22125 [Gammaproteobacteria bacterium]